MASLTLIRDSGWADYFRTYRILLDGKLICEVRNGETKLVLVSPGEHSLAVRIDWGGSKTIQFTATENETISFHIKSNIRGWRLFLALWFALFDWNSYVELKRLSTSYGDKMLEETSWRKQDT